MDPNKLLKISFIGIETDPKLMFIKNKAISKITNTINGVLYVPFFVKLL